MGRRWQSSPSIPLAFPSLYISALSNAAGDSGSPHPCRTYGVARPAQRPVSTALGCRSLIRMRSPAQVLASSPTALDQRKCWSYGSGWIPDRSRGSDSQSLRRYEPQTMASQAPRLRWLERDTRGSQIGLLHYRIRGWDSSYLSEQFVIIGDKRRWGRRGESIGLHNALKSISGRVGELTTPADGRIGVTENSAFPTAAGIGTSSPSSTSVTPRFPWLPGVGTNVQWPFRNSVPSSFRSNVNVSPSILKNAVHT
jgi:hypothetical protein